MFPHSNSYLKVLKIDAKQQIRSQNPLLPFLPFIFSFRRPRMLRLAAQVLVDLPQPLSLLTAPLTILSMEKKFAWFKKESSDVFTNRGMGSSGRVGLKKIWSLQEVLITLNKINWKTKQSSFLLILAIFMCWIMNINAIFSSLFFQKLFQYR